jgi:hypothetical protein
VRCVLPRTLLVALAAVSAAFAQESWSVSPTVVVPRARHYVYGDERPCAGVLLVDEGIMSNLARVGHRPVDPATGQPSRLALALGLTLDAIGLNTMGQSHAECAEVCAAVPADAQRITSIVGYASNRNGVFVREPFGHGGSHFSFDAGVDTSRFVDGRRLVCVVARNWDDVVERRVYVVVGYER